MARLEGPTRALVALHLVVAVLGGVYVSLRESELAEAEAKMARCTPVEQEVLDALGQRLSEEAEPGSLLRLGFTVPGRDGVFLSAQLWRPELPETAPGEILTWTAPSTGAGPDQLRAVDDKARRYSTSPPAGKGVVVTHDASIASRACVDESRPGRKSLFR